MLAVWGLVKVLAVWGLVKVFEVLKGFVKVFKFCKVEVILGRFVCWEVVDTRIRTRTSRLLLKNGLVFMSKLMYLEMNLAGL